MAGAAGWASSQGALREGLAAAHSGRPSTIIHICQYQKFLIISTAVAQRFKLLSLFLKVAGSIPGVVKFPMRMALFFFGGACGGRRDKPNQHGARTDASPLACCRVVPCVAFYLLASLPCTELDHPRAHVSSAHMP